MDERTPGRGVSITSSGDTVWTFTLEGKGLPSEDEFYVRMPVKSVYVPKIKDGVCSIMPSMEPLHWQTICFAPIVIQLM